MEFEDEIIRIEDEEETTRCIWYVTTSNSFILQKLHDKRIVLNAIIIFNKPDTNLNFKSTY